MKNNKPVIFCSNIFSLIINKLFLMNIVNVKQTFSIMKKQLKSLNNSLYKFAYKFHKPETCPKIISLKYNIFSFEREGREIVSYGDASNAMKLECERIVKKNNVITDVTTDKEKNCSIIPCLTDAEIYKKYYDELKVNNIVCAYILYFGRYPSSGVVFPYLISDIDSYYNSLGSYDYVKLLEKKYNVNLYSNYAIFHVIVPKYAVNIISYRLKTHITSISEFLCYPDEYTCGRFNSLYFKVKDFEGLLLNYLQNIKDDNNDHSVVSVKEKKVLPYLKIKNIQYTNI